MLQQRWALITSTVRTDYLFTKKKKILKKYVQFRVDNFFFFFLNITDLTLVTIELKYRIRFYTDNMENNFNNRSNCHYYNVVTR